MKMLYVVFVNEKPILEKKFQENSSKNIRRSWEKINDLERFYAIQKQPLQVLY